jgi:Domain of unknown function (DUF4234)
MATDVNIGGQIFKKRSIWVAWLLPVVTFGIYHFVWWYKINNEARRYLDDSSINPTLSVLALIPGFILIVPPYVSVYRTAGRVRRMQQHAGIPDRITPWIALALAFVFSLHSLYIQLELNKIWDRYLPHAGGLMSAPPPLGIPGAAPPPAPPATP